MTVQLPGGVETGPVSTLSTFLLHSLAIGAMEEPVAGARLAERQHESCRWR